VLKPENAKGIVKVKFGDVNSSHLMMASDEKSLSGLTPPRFHADTDEDMHELRFKKPSG
jgi:hypothetical protein